MGHRPVRLAATALAAIVALGGAGCGASYEDPATDPEENRLVGTAWRLTLVQLPGGARLPVHDPGAYELLFAEDDRFVVRAGGNQCVGHYNSGGRALAVRLDCPLDTAFPPGSVGREFLALLSRATHFGMTGSRDELYIDSGPSGGTLNFRRLERAAGP